MPYALMIHGGAGAIAGRDYSEAESHLSELACEGQRQLESGASALDVTEWAVAEMESSGLYVAGRGSAPNSAGEVELDASIMDGARHRAGGVAAVRDLVNPVRAARQVMEQTPHVLLAGDGARVFALQAGLEAVTAPGEYYRTPVGLHPDELQGDLRHGTVGAVALDSAGRLAAATSTGGTLGKLHGRVGDSPLVGPGTWADDAVAISCTGTGEHIILAGGAYDVAARLRYGNCTLRDAIDGMLDRVAQLGGDAGVIAVNSRGEMAFNFNSEGLKRAFVSSEVAVTCETFARPQ